MFILPYGVFFKPTKKFLETLALPEYQAPTLEAGAGVGFTLKAIKDYGKEHNIGSMIHARGFDINYRSSYACKKGEIFIQDATNCSFYAKNQNILVCRPDHGGWVSELLGMFLDNIEECKRFIYVGLEENLTVDFTEDQLSCVSKVITGVGEDEEVMYVWEMR